MSDATHLTNFSGDKKLHPVYISIGNISSEFRLKQSARATQLLAMLPIPPKKPDSVTQTQWDRDADRVRQVRYESLHLILDDFCDATITDGATLLCGDGHYRSIYMRISSWIADFPEHCDLAGIQRNRCPWCEVPHHELGKHTTEYKSRTNKPPCKRNHQRYAQFVDEALSPTPERSSSESSSSFRDRINDHRAKTANLRADLKDVGVLPIRNALWNLHDCDLTVLPKPDKLHTIYLGLVEKHLMEWITAMLSKHGRLERFIALSKRVPAYLDLTAPKRSYQEVTQWNGKEIKNMSRYLYATLAATLSEPAPKSYERQHFTEVLQATKSLLEVAMYMEYDSHDEETMGYLDDAIRTFFVQKKAFLPYRAGKNSAALANDERVRLIQQRDAEIQEAKKRGATATEIKRITTEYKDTIRINVDKVLEEDSHFNFPKIHMLLHVVQSVRMFGTLGQHNSNISETAHKESKEGFRRSNRTGEWTQQILNRSARREAFALRQNWLAWYNNRQHPPEPHPFPPVIQEGIKPPPPLLVGLRKPTEKRGDTPIRTMYEVIESAAVPGFKEAFKVYVEAALNQRFQDNIHLRAPASLFHGIQLYTPLLSNGGWGRQKIRCSPNRDWYNAGERGDWAWIQVNPTDSRRSRAARSAPSTGSSMNALFGRLPVRIRCIFRVQMVNNRGNANTYDLVLCEVPMAVRSGEPDSRTGLVSLCRPDMMGPSVSGSNEFRGYVNEYGANLKVFGAVVIDGAAHCIPLQDSGAEWSWLVNPHIDLATWNLVYR